MKTITEQFGERLKKIRTQKSLSQEQLSYLADIDRSYISDVERGARNISLENIYKLASALNIPPYLLLLNSANLLDRRSEEHTSDSSHITPSRMPSSA